MTGDPRAPRAEFTIHVPTPADAPDLARVHVAGWRAAYGHLLPERWFGAEAVDHRTVQWERWLTDVESGATPASFRVGRDPQGRAVGVAASGPGRDRPPVRPLELTLLYVDVDRYGSGLGAALLEATLGTSPASLWVAEDNARARRFYAKHGFAADGTWKVEEQLEGLREIRMVR